ncbi:YdeI/OmpD-associated family protein [Lysobacter sp. A3-1-A15]|uniref:YdeI/OmpD-associated family protein n=1 Tax=Novilysobacter viscosus TaxID=3098602 RepID=UPI002ED86697
MSTANAPVRFKARLLRPAKPANATWTFLVVPKAASAKLPSRGQVGVEGTLAGQAFTAVMEPDGQGNHWMKVGRTLREATGAEAGDTVQLEITPSGTMPEPRLPAGLRKALADSPDARATWDDITPAARHDWIAWIASAKREDTRVRRIGNACDMLATGKRRVCCFDRSGMYGKGVSAPEAAST